MGRLVDRYLTDETLALRPLHPNQHSYQTRKYVETSLHQLVVQVEKVLDQKEIALGIFLDIEAAFNNTACTLYALVRHRVDQTIVRGLRYPGDAHRGVCCRHFYHAWLWMF